MSQDYSNATKINGSVDMNTQCVSVLNEIVYACITECLNCFQSPPLSAQKAKLQLDLIRNSNYIWSSAPIPSCPYRGANRPW